MYAMKTFAPLDAPLVILLCISYNIPWVICHMGCAMARTMGHSIGYPTERIAPSCFPLSSMAFSHDTPRSVSHGFFVGEMPHGDGLDDSRGIP